MNLTEAQLRNIIRRNIIREERGDYYMSQYADTETAEGTPTRRPELQAILDAANDAHGIVPYRVLKDFFWSLNSTYATKRKIMEKKAVKITKQQLRRIIKESIREAGGFRDYGEEEIEYTSLAGTLGETNPEYADNDEFEDSEYKRGYQDALDDLPMADDATAAYDDGYETASSELEADIKAAEEILSTRIGSYRGQMLPGGEKIR